MELGVLGHLLDLFLGQTGGTLNGDLLLFTGAEVLGGNVENTVGVDVEGDLDLRGAASGRRDAVELEGTEVLVVAGHGALALKNHDFDAGLVVRVGREHLRLLGRNGGVTSDHGRGNIARGHDAEGERGDVEQENVFNVTLEHAALNGCADGDHLVGIHALVSGFAGELVGDLDHLGHTGHTADQHEFVDVGGSQLGILQAVLEGAQGALEQAIANLLHLGAGKRDIHVLRAGSIGGDERQVDVHRQGRGEGNLGLLSLFLQALKGHRIFTQVDALLGLEAVNQPVNQGLVPVVAAEVGVAVGGLDLKHAVTDFEDGDVKSAAAQVEHGDLLVLLLVETVSERSGGGLVDDAQHLETGDLAGVLGGLALGVVEIGGHGDDGLGDLLTEVGLGVGLELAEDHGGDLLGSELLGLVADLNLDGGVAVFAGHDLVGEILGLFAALAELAAD